MFANSLRFFVGTYTQGVPHSEGIYSFNLDVISGRVNQLSTTGGLQNPSFLALNPSKSHLYVVSEINSHCGKDEGSVSAFLVGDDGHLLEEVRRGTGGAGPCHIRVNANGTVLIATNYQGGSVASYPIDSQGFLGELATFAQHEGASVDVDRQNEAHAHASIFSEDGLISYVTDLGMDRIVAYKLDPLNARLISSEEIDTKTHSGAGPRHMAWHPNLGILYVINELDSTISTYSHKRDNSLGFVQTVDTIPDDFSGRNTCADIHVSQDGRFVYGTNRGHDSIAIFEIEGGSGIITPKGHHHTGGKTPRNFKLSAEGDIVLVANQDTNNVVMFRRNAKDGSLVDTGVEINVPRPVCIEFF